MAHVHNVVDTDTHYIIDGNTKEIANTFEVKRVLIQNDHNSERLTFEIPRFFDGHDLLSCNLNEVIYYNTDKVKKEKKYGAYEIKDLKKKEGNEDVLIFTWLISDDATEFDGSIVFNISFQCVNNNDKVEYALNTALFELKVEPGMPKDAKGNIKVISLEPECWYERSEESWT